MKKLLAVVVIGVLAIAVNAFAQGAASTTKEVKQKVETTGDTTKTTTTVKGTDVKMQKTVTDTPTGETGKAKLSVTNGAIDNMKISWTYKQVGTEYITEYTIKDTTAPGFKNEFTAAELNALKPGTYRVVSTSPYTGQDIKDNIRAAILKDIKMSLSNPATTPTKTK